MADGVGKGVISELAGLATGVAKSAAEEPGKLASSAGKQLKGQQQGGLDPQMIAQKQQQDQQAEQAVLARLHQMKQKQQMVAQQMGQAEQQRTQQPIKAEANKGLNQQSSQPGAAPAALSQRNTAEKKRTIGG